MLSRPISCPNWCAETRPQCLLRNSRQPCPTCLCGWISSPSLRRLAWLAPSWHMRRLTRGWPSRCVAGPSLLLTLMPTLQSIPAYVEHSTIITVLAPPATHADTTDAEGNPTYCNYQSWRSRGWSLPSHPNPNHPWERPDLTVPMEVSCRICSRPPCEAAGSYHVGARSGVRQLLPNPSNG